MHLESTQVSLLPAYLASFGHLIGDARTGVTFGEIVKGIIGAGSLVCQQIAASSAILSEAKDGARRVRRLVKAKSTKRSSMDAASVTAAVPSSRIDSPAWLMELDMSSDCVPVRVCDVSVNVISGGGFPGPIPFGGFRSGVYLPAGGHPRGPHRECRTFGSSCEETRFPQGLTRSRRRRCRDKPRCCGGVSDPRGR